MTSLIGFARTVQAAFKPLAEPAAYRVQTNTTVRTAALVPAGATTITFNTVPASYPATAVNDTFVIGTGTYVVTSAVTTAGGVLTGVTFTPALAAQVASGAVVMLARRADYPVSAIVVQVSGYNLLGGIYGGGEYKATILGLPDTIEPSGSGLHRIIWRGKSLTVKSGIGRDSARAGWIVQAL